jgi:hypothetical protein
MRRTNADTGVRLPNAFDLKNLGNASCSIALKQYSFCPWNISGICANILSSLGVFGSCELLSGKLWMRSDGGRYISWFSVELTVFPAGERYRKNIRSADAMRSMRVMAEERGITVGARDPRFVLNNVGVMPDRENGVVERGALPSPASTWVWSDMTPGVIGVCGRGLVERLSPLTFSSPMLARLGSLIPSFVLFVLRLVPPPVGDSPMTVP